LTINAVAQCSRFLKKAKQGKENKDMGDEGADWEALLAVPKLG
jgi:hypothetical protein